MPMESGTNQTMQLHLNVPIKTPLQHLHDLVAHNATPIDEDLLRQNPMEDEGDDESTAENFKQVTREGDLSPTTSAKGAMDKLHLWDNLYYLASDMELPWLVGLDFNVIFHEDEKIGGLPVHPPEYEDFAFCNMLPTIEVEHLIRTGSDHAPLLMTCGVQTTNFVKPFRFLNFWTKHATFINVVRQNWEANFIGDQFLMFKQNIKRDIVRVKEMLFEEEPTTKNRIMLQKAQSELKKYLNIEEQYWKQKAGMTWFTEGDRIISFFHNHVNGKRKKLQLKRIKSSSGVWIEDQKQLATAAVDFYQK
ncbi:uncharacterized protein LOC142167309 [Nicotiana tabacum]|uniref:Uncharacterized protein LOC142167309 n=1 Tax=Nicotiana tabacum TaxID=4097 RepID=A0AC58SF32_TOBAC